VNRQAIERRESLSPEEFFSTYVKLGIPVVVSNALTRCEALQQWHLDYFKARAGKQIVRIKEGYLPNLTVSNMALEDYLDHISKYEYGFQHGLSTTKDMPGYLHDIPLVSLLGDAIANELSGFPAEYFPKWYRSDWWRFSQFFLGPTNSLTPLHFDTLLTHNLFFQVAGRKRFIVFPFKQQAYCYRTYAKYISIDM
jgi:hypothetical protein